MLAKTGKTAAQSLYEPQAAKTLDTVLRNFLLEQLPGLLGPLTVEVLVEALRELLDKYLPPLTRIKAGQMLWFAVAKDDPGYGKTMQHTRLVPILLDVVATEDIEAYQQGKPRIDIVRAAEARLFTQADNQQGTLAETDVALILKRSRSCVANDIAAYEKGHNIVLPRRGTVHDMGGSVTHKVLICRKKYLEGKSPTQIKRETYHDELSQDRYTTSLEMVRFCISRGLTVAETAFVTKMGQKLVLEYKNLAEQLVTESSNNPNKEP
ncbi:MAG: DUF1670 domain-containing protein [Candidatus Kerfeldbacteria bacterium]|nr:DUF1670 domain-containing protein [Candidatus Kerfeldbacteria bacterium]